MGGRDRGPGRALGDRADGLDNLRVTEAIAETARHGKAR
jgi:hypothetical protein